MAGPPRFPRPSRLGVRLAGIAAASTALAGCGLHVWPDGADDEALERGGSAITLAFAGDVHFAGELQDSATDDDSTLGPLSSALSAADLAMVNLETAVTSRTAQADKELEDPGNRYWFRTSAGALDLLERSGIDVASIANNHAGDYGVAGLQDTLRAGDASDVALVGAGADAAAAFTPYRTTVRGTDIAVLAGDASPLESEDDVWSVREGSGPGIAGARGQSVQLVDAVTQAAEDDDVVVVYMHWGEEGATCPSPSQRALAERLSAAGADVVVGAHPHTLQGSGRLDSTYVSYSLGNFYWYNGSQSDTGVLQLSVADGQVVGEDFIPGRIAEDGGPAQAARGGAASSAVADWQALRGCTGLEAATPDPSAEASGEEGEEDLPDFESSIRRIDAAVRERMTSHDPEVCPVDLADLRYLTVTYVGFDGGAHLGELVVAEDVARDVVDVFDTLYEQQYPIRSMLLIDEFGGDDDRSMAANNSSGYNCRRVSGSESWSDHAYGRAIDLNPVQNPYVVEGDVRPPAAERFADLDRGSGAEVGAGVITDGDPVVEAFERIGWEWGDAFTDYQHFSDPTG